MTEDAVRSEDFPRVGWGTVLMDREGILSGKVLVSGMIDWERFWPVSMTAYRTRISAQAAAEMLTDKMREAGQDFRVIAHPIHRHVWVVWAVSRGSEYKELLMRLALLEAEVIPSLLDRVRDRL